MFGFPPVARRPLASVLSALALLAVASPAARQSPLAIRHQAVGCILPGRYPLLSAEILPATEIRNAKLYFRAERFADFYYVVMKATPRGGYQAVIPRPGPETDRFIYYIEAVGLSFDSARTEEHVAEVGQDCGGDPAAAYFDGGSPGITVGATQAGAAAIPPGFQAAGIVGFLDASGAGAGGGFGVGTAILVGAGAAAGVGVIGASSGGAGSSTTIQPSEITVTTTTAGGTTTALTSSTTSSVPPGQTTSSSTTTSLSTSSTTTSVLAPTACFSTRSLTACKTELDAGCSTGAIQEYRWTFHQSSGPVNETRSSADPFVHDWAGDSACGGRNCSFSRQVELIAVGPGGSNRFNDQARVTCLTGLVPDETGLATSFSSFLAVQPAGGARGQVRINASHMDAVEALAAVHHHLRARSGENVVEAEVLTPIAGEGFWRFDFSGAEHFVAGSLEVDSGAVVSLDARSAVFRLSGGSTERILFRYRLSSN